MVNKPRIYQLLRRAGVIATRTDALKLLNERKVLVNDKPIHNPDFQVNPKKESILVDGIPLKLEIPKKYFILNKPKGYLTSKKRSHGKRHIMELIRCDAKLKNTLFPVGRLDYNTTGLIIITNDGDFAHNILQPHNNIEKEYLVIIDGQLKDNGLKQLQTGITIAVDNKPYQTLPAEVHIINRSRQSTTFSIIIIEGKKRQVRLMVAALGYKVLSLKRMRIGRLQLGTLAEGDFRTLSESEIKRIK